MQLHCCGVKSWKDYQTEFVPARIVPVSCCIPATRNICDDAARTNPEQNTKLLFASVSSPGERLLQLGGNFKVQLPLCMSSQLGP